MKLITEKTFIKVDFGKEIKGIFDNRTNLGLIVFEKEEEIKQSDNYYLIEINKENENKNLNLTEITVDIYASSKKDDSNFSIPINKYISGSFNLESDKIKPQRYYFNDVHNYSSNEYYIEFSSNYNFLRIEFNEHLKYKHIITNGGIQIYSANVDKSNPNENYFDIKINNTIPKNEKHNDYCEKANYIIRYYQKKRNI